MSKQKSTLTEERTKTWSIRFVVALLLIAVGIAWVAWYYVSVRPDPTVFPPVEGSPEQIAELGRWNYVIGFGLLMLGLVVAAHRSTPLGRGRGVIVGMLGCFIIGLIWICVYYIFSTPEKLAQIPVFNDLNQWNLAVGIAFMGVGFSYATKWE